MTPEQYQTVFELGFKSFPWIDWLHPCILVVIGLGLYKFAKRQFVKAVGFLGLVVSTIFFLITSIIYIPDSIRKYYEYKHGRSSIVEGSVENFRPMLMLGPSEESFTVNGVDFAYNAGTDSCFRNGPYHKGPIRSGMKVRIVYNGTCIQRVDVAR